MRDIQVVIDMIKDLERRHEEQIRSCQERLKSLEDRVFTHENQRHYSGPLMLD